MTFASPISRALFAAACMLGAAAALKWASAEYLDPGLARRLGGLLLGAIVVCYANVIPKSLTALARLRCAPEREQAARRFAGWSLVLGGLGYMLACLCVPLDAMHAIGGAILAVALLAALVRCFTASMHAARG